MLQIGFLPEGTHHHSICMSMHWLRDGLRACWHVFYPHLCVSCSTPLPALDAFCCLRCQAALPYTDHHRFRENTFTERFWGRLPLERGVALFHFVKQGRVQQLVHHLKYEGRQDIGYALGRSYGRTLAEAWTDDPPQAIVPVPLHPRKRHRRGYNQAAVFARGLSATLHLPVREQVLVRTTYATSQTAKGRQERFQNVSAAFRLKHPRRIAGQHLLLVDDVLTTGATLEACAQQLLQAPGVRISMATIAIAQM